MYCLHPSYPEEEWAIYAEDFVLWSGYNDEPVIFVLSTGTHQQPFHPSSRIFFNKQIYNTSKTGEADKHLFCFKHTPSMCTLQGREAHNQPQLQFIAIFGDKTEAMMCCYHTKTLPFFLKAFRWRSNNIPNKQKSYSEEQKIMQEHYINRQVKFSWPTNYHNHRALNLNKQYHTHFIYSFYYSNFIPNFDPPNCIPKSFHNITYLSNNLLWQPELWKQWHVWWFSCTLWSKYLNLCLS